MEIVKDLMVSVADCATVDQEATIREAIQIIERARGQQHSKGRTCHYRALLVLNKDKEVVGKLDYIDIVKNMEPKYRSQKIAEATAHIFAAGLSSALLKSMMHRYSFWDVPFETRCQQVLAVKVNECMHNPGNDECVQQSDSLELAVHQLVIGRHQSLLVIENDTVVGMLTLTDLFERVFLRCQVQSEFHSPPSKGAS